MGEIYKCRDCGNPTGNKHIIAMTRGNDLIIHRCNECQDKLRAEIEWQNEQWQEDNIICPWCNDCFSDYDDMLQVTDSPYEDFVGTVKCPSCGKEFDLEIETKCTYTTKKPYKLFDYAQWCENQENRNLEDKICELNMAIILKQLKKLKLEKKLAISGQTDIIIGQVMIHLLLENNY